MPVMALAWIALAARMAVAQEASLVEVRVVPSSQGTTVDLGITGPVGYTDFTLENPSRLVIDLSNARQALPRASYPVGRGGVTAVRSSQFAPGVVRVILDLAGPVAYATESTAGGVSIRLAGGPAAFEPWSSAQADVNVAGVSGQVARQEPRITVNFQEADIRDVLASFADFTGRSIVPGSGVTGTITATIQDQPWDVALQTILRAYGFATQEHASGIIQVDEIQNLQTRQTVEQLVTQTFRINYVPVNELQASLTPLISERGRISASPSTNTLIVTDVEGVIANIVSVVQQLDVRTPQVSIQAKIIFVNRTDIEELGVTYDLKDSQGSTLNELVSVPDPLNPGVFTNQDIVSLGGNSIAALGNANVRVQSPQLESVLSLILGRHTLITFIDALQSQELSDVQAEPLMTTLDNQEAQILVGERTPIRVVDLGTASAGAGAALPRATAELVETGIRLLVKPTVTADRRILLQLRAERSSAQLAATDIGVVFQTQEATTRLMVNDGETAVIGGLTVTEVFETRAGIPFLMDLPIIGSLFRTTRNREQKRDLLIMVTPRILEDRV